MKNTNKSNSKKLELYSVKCNTDGHGLPYAPINWPEIGDTWKWSVGKRMKKSGLHQDIYLYPPPNLKKALDGRPYIGSKHHLKKYIEQEFPNKNYKEFLNLFSWDIPHEDSSKVGGKKERKTAKKGRAANAIHTEKPLAEGPTCGKKKIKRKLDKLDSPKPIGRRSCRQRSFKGTKKESVFIDISEEDEEADMILSSEGSEENHSDSKEELSSDDDFSFKDNTTIPELAMVIYDDNIANNRAMVIYDPNIEKKQAGTKMENADLETKIGIEAEPKTKWVKLELLLRDNKFDLVSKTWLSKLMEAIAEIKQETSSLSIKDLLKLHELEKIPLLAQSFAQVDEELKNDTYSTDCAANIGKIIPLINSHHECKSKGTERTKEVVKNFLEKKKTKEIISKLQQKVAKLHSLLSEEKRARNELISTRQSAAGLIPKLMKAIEFGSARRYELEEEKGKTMNEMKKIIANYMG